MDASRRHPTEPLTVVLDAEVERRRPCTPSDVDPNLAVICHRCRWSGILADAPPIEPGAPPVPLGEQVLGCHCPECQGPVHEAETPAAAHFARPGTEHADAPVACDTCEWVGRGRDALVILDIEYRLMPGRAIPAGECPACGGLAHPLPGGE